MFRRLLLLLLFSPSNPDLRMDWIHPWIGLDWIGLGRNFEEHMWVGLDWVRSPKKSFLNSEIASLYF